MRRNASSVILETANLDKNNFIKILDKFDFPNVKDPSGFINEIHDHVQRYATEIEFSQSLSEADVIGTETAFSSYNGGRLEFIENGLVRKFIIENFMPLYLHIPMIMKNANHFFDEELHIKKLLHDNCISPEIRERIFFKKSENEIRIQFSDVIVGFLAKYFTFVDNMSFSKLSATILTLNETQKDTMCILRDMFKYADLMSRGSSVRIDSIYNCEKSDFFLSRL